MRYTICSQFKIAKSGKGFTAAYGTVITKDELGLTHVTPFKIWVGMRDGKTLTPKAMVSAYAKYNDGPSVLSPSVVEDDVFTAWNRAIPASKLMELADAAETYELTLDSELKEISRRLVNIVTEEQSAVLAKYAARFKSAAAGSEALAAGSKTPEQVKEAARQARLNARNG